MKIVTTIILALLVAGCVTKTVGHQFAVDKVDTLVPGTTTYEEAKAALGTPVGVQANPNTGERAVVWYYIKARGGAYSASAHAEKLVVLFDKNNVMKGITQRASVSSGT